MGEEGTSKQLWHKLKTPNLKGSIQKEDEEGRISKQPRQVLKIPELKGSIEKKDEEGRSEQPWQLIKIPPNFKGFVPEEDDGLEEGEIREEADIGSKDLKISLDPNPNKDNNRVCPECSKEFASGKALGGHMRIHAAPSKKNLQMIKTVKIVKNKQINNKVIDKADYMSKCTDKNGQPICMICGKNFPSFKSLFGHMRCHPERYWRGIMPPDHHQLSLVDQSDNRKKSSSSSSSLISTDDSEDDSDGDDDPVIDFPKWTVRAKRGRKVEISCSSGEEEEEEEVKTWDAVEDLMMLKGGDKSLDLTLKQQKVNEIEVSNSNSVTIKDDSGLKNSYLDKEKASIEMSDELSNNNELQLTLNSNTVSTTPNKMRRKKKMRFMMDLEPGLEVTPTKAQQKPNVVDATTPPDKYKCTTCNKSFPTHQALGGHRSSHNKFKVTILNAVANKDEHGGDEDNGSNENSVKLDENAKESGSTSIHQCTICNKVFPTGQALGGHKRCHWTGPPPADQSRPPSSSQVTSSSPGEASHTASAVAAEGVRRLLDFDLNEAPTVEDEGDDGNGYAVSSSYNSNSNNG